MTRLLEEIAIYLGASLNEVSKLIASAPRRYKVYQIPKRRGGVRTIAQPAAEIKVIQKFIISNKLSLFPVHQIASAYVTERGIADNAAVHVDSDFILKMDFRNFFPSLRPRDLEIVNRRTRPSPIEKADLELYYHLLFWGEGGREPASLSIGAPSSPMLSNIIMYSLDTEISLLGERYDVRVTRYADDITASSGSRAKLSRFESSLRRLIDRTASPRLQINEEKTGVYSKAERRMVTGVVLTPDRRVSIGRDRKREISSLIFLFSRGSLSDTQTMYAKGMVAFAMSIEPSFVLSMRTKYGTNVISDLLSIENKRREV